MGFLSRLFGPAKPPREQAKERARNWWLGKGANASPAKCDICANSVAPREGYLLRTGQVAESGSYVTVVSEQLAKETVSSAGGPGMDWIVRDALMPAAAFAVRDTAIARIKSVSTPWLVCDSCMSRHFEKVVPAS